MNDQPIITKRHVLEVLRNYSSFKIQGETREILLSGDFDIDFDQYRVMLEADVMAEKLAEDTYTSERIVFWPETTWQMFKETNKDRWWLRWLVKRRPVRYQQKDFEMSVDVARYLKYPEMAIRDPRMGKAVIHELVQVGV